MKPFVWSPGSLLGYSDSLFSFMQNLLFLSSIKQLDCLIYAPLRVILRKLRQSSKYIYFYACIIMKRWTICGMYRIWKAIRQLINLRFHILLGNKMVFVIDWLTLVSIVLPSFGGSLRLLNSKAFYLKKLMDSLATFFDSSLAHFSLLFQSCIYFNKGQCT